MQFRNSKGQFIKGHKANFGIVRTEETKILMSNIMKNRPHPELLPYQFKKGHPSFLKGIHQTEEYRKKLSMILKGRKSWLKGKNYIEVYGEKRAKEIINKISEKNKISHKGKKPKNMSGLIMFSKGHIVSSELREKLRQINTGKKCSEETKKKLSDYFKGKPNLHIRGEKNWNWKGGKPKCSICGKILSSYMAKKCCKCELTLRNKKMGILKRGLNHHNWKGGISSSKYYKRLCHFKRRFLRGGKNLNLKIIQLVYENNIKKYGTLTCIYCLKPIEFGQDTIDHKIPLARGGTNEYENLAIACRKCNCRKWTKTEEEFKNVF